MSSWGERLGQRLWVIGLVLFVAGFLNDPPWKWYNASQHYERYGEMYRVALNLAHDGNFANPFGPLATGPTAHVAPGYTFVESVVVRLFGEGAQGWLAIRVLATALLSLQFALLPWVARTFGLSAWVGVLAAVIGLIVKVPKEELWENHAAGLLILLLAVGMQLARTKRGEIWLGLGTGLAFLVQPLIAIPYFAWARKRWLILLPLAVTAPWIARTYAELGALAFVRDNLGLELYVSFNDCAPYGIRASERLGCSVDRHPYISLPEATAVKEMGEYRYNQDRMRTALAWMARHPVRTVQLLAERTWFFWVPSEDGLRGYSSQRTRYWVMHLATVLSFFGLFRMWWLKLPSARVLTLWVALFPLLYYVVQFETRYRFPTLWITFLLAAFAVMPTRSATFSPKRATIKDSPNVAF